MFGPLEEMIIRQASPSDVRAVAGLRSLWRTGAEVNPGFERRMRDWLAGESDRRTTWLAGLDDLAAGMVSMLEYRRMPHPGQLDSMWGYISNMFVAAEFRRRGIGSALLQETIDAAHERRSARLVLSPNEEGSRSLSGPGSSALNRPPVPPVCSSASASPRNEHTSSVAQAATRVVLPLGVPTERERQPRPDRPCLVAGGACQQQPEFVADVWCHSEQRACKHSMPVCREARGLVSRGAVLLWWCGMPRRPAGAAVREFRGGFSADAERR